MKKLLTLAVGAVVLATFTGLSVAQERKAGPKSSAQEQKAGKKPVEPAAIPPADTLTVSSDPNVVSYKGCPVIARPWNKSNPKWTYAGQPLKFVKVPGGQVLFSGKTNAKGILPWTVPNNTTVRAESPGMPNKPPLLISNDFACGEKYPSK
jgi:hypothetical protein